MPTTVESPPPSAAAPSAETDDVVGLALSVQDRPEMIGKGAALELIRHDGRSTTLAGLAVSLVLLVVAFRSNLVHFFILWRTDDNYSHGFLVPFISLYFAHQVAKRGPMTVRSGVGLGAAMLGTALLGRLATVLIPVGFISDLSFLIGLAGLFTILFGVEVLKRYGFALFFLIFMVPLPVALYAKIASPLQLLASQIASLILNATGVPVLCEGNLMTLPGGIRMFVAEACSGMRQLTGFLALTAAVAYMTQRPAWYRTIIVVAALPIAITANVARVTVTGYIMFFLDPRYAEGTFHTVEGLVMMGFGLALLLGACRVLDQVYVLVGGDLHEGSPAEPRTQLDPGLSPSS